MIFNYMKLLLKFLRIMNHDGLWGESRVVVKSQVHTTIHEGRASRAGFRFKLVAPGLQAAKTIKT